VKRARDHLHELGQAISLRRVYADLDGTLLGPGGSLFSHPDGVTGEAAAALVALAEAGIGLVLVSGRTQEQVREAARTLGADAYIAEIGGLVVHRDGREEVTTRNRGSFAGRGTPFEAIQRSGAAGLMLTAYPGRLEPHTPWSSLARECSVLLRGNVPLQEANDTLERSGNGWLELLDNGIMSAAGGRFPGLEKDEVHAYHLVPKGVSKASAIAVDRARVGLGSTACIAVGDSASDVASASEVGAVFVVANGEPAVSGLALADNVYLMDRSHGLGFVDAITPFINPQTGPAAVR
jgi:hydroxymethylpyrimidine pyrophosphatase-like HAD family hydrolase